MICCCPVSLSYNFYIFLIFTFHHFLLTNWIIIFLSACVMYKKLLFFLLKECQFKFWHLSVHVCFVECKVYLDIFRKMKKKFKGIFSFSGKHEKYSRGRETSLTWEKYLVIPNCCCDKLVTIIDWNQFRNLKTQRKNSKIF